MSWSPTQYSKFEAERSRPVKDLVAQIPNKMVAHAADIGCGPGNSTEILQTRFPDATIVGVDNSREMIEAVRKRTGAACVLAPDYGTTSWLAFYLPKGTCVVQPTQRIRWVNMAEPDTAQLSGKLLWVDEARLLAQPYVTDTFGKVERVAELERMRGPLVIESYELDLLEDARRPVLDDSPPGELSR